MSQSHTDVLLALFILGLSSLFLLLFLTSPPPLSLMSPSSTSPLPPAPSFQRNLVVPSTKMTLDRTNNSCTNDMLLAMPKPQFKSTHSTPLLPIRPYSQPERSHSHTTRSVSAEPTRKQEQLSASSFSKIRLLGKGDVGKVYLVKQKDNGNLYALKGMNTFPNRSSSFFYSCCCCI